MSSLLYDEKDENLKICTSLANRVNLEENALGGLTSEILQKLNISIDILPNNCRSLVKHLAELQNTLELQALDSISISLYSTRDLSGKLDDEYEILKLNQKNADLDAKISRNDKFISQMRKELEMSKQSLSTQNPNPVNIKDYLSQLKQKLKTYEISYEQAKKSYASLNIPETILPKSLNSQVTSLEALKNEAHELKERADEVMIMREAKENLYRLRK